MTAEVVVLNKSAIALAADSKVTISGMSASKTYDTVSKVFTLSKVHPVGIMIFGNADFMNYPWETIIKVYRRQKGAAHEPTLESWGVDFRKFLLAFGKIERKHKQENVKGIVGSWLLQARDEAMSLARDRNILVPSPEFVSILTERLDSQAADFREAGLYFTAAQAKALSKTVIKDVLAVVKEHFGRYSDDELIRKAVQMSGLALVSNALSPHMSGFVVAGFGENEYFPAFVEYNTDGYVGDAVKIIKNDSTEITRDNGSCIRAFAQGDMVQRFMNGVDSGFREVVELTFVRSLHETSMQVLEEYGNQRKKTKKTRDNIADAVKESGEKLHKAIDNYLKRNLWQPIIQMVTLLPKDELAHLAESLVALTSLKRRVSSDAETVGGAVDVALISKGDGFVWVKRKHYFSPDLNPSFNRNYLRGIPLGDYHGEDNNAGA